MSLLTTLLESSGSSTNNLLDFRGSYNASVNTFPATGGSGNSGAILKGDFWLISVGGTLGGSVVSVGDTLFATVDTPGQTAGNWAVLEGNIGFTPENAANKDATGGYAGLTLFKINFNNALNTFTSFLTNSNTAARTYTFQDRNGTIADDTDLALKAPLAAPVFTGIITGGSRIKYGTNVESLSGNKSITTNDVQVQLLNPNGADRDVTLYATPATGDAFIFKNTGSAGNVLALKNNGGTTLVTIANGVSAAVVYDGTNWQLM